MRYQAMDVLYGFYAGMLVQAALIARPHDKWSFVVLGIGLVILILALCPRDLWQRAFDFLRREQ